MQPSRLELCGPAPAHLPLTYPELWHLDDEAHGHVDDGALPVVHGDEVGGQLVEPRVQPAGKQRESTAGTIVTPAPAAGTALPAPGLPPWPGAE